MKATFFKYLRSLVFVSIVVVVMMLLDYALVPSGYIRFVIHEVNAGENYDCIVVGASHGRSDINPYMLDESGLTDNAFNLSIPGETVIDTHYLIREADRTNDIRTVIFDLDYQYWCDYPERAFGDCFIYTWLPMDVVKASYVYDNLWEKDFRTTYSKRWAWVISSDEIKKNIETKKSAAYKNYDIEAVEVRDAGGPYVGKGFFSRNPVSDKGEHETVAFDEGKISQKVVDAFDKTVDYCKKNDIELICISSPITPNSIVMKEMVGAHDYFVELCAKKNVEYIDFNLASFEDLPRTDEDFIDWDGHMNGEMAQRYSVVLAKEILARKEGRDGVRFYSSYEKMQRAK